jgi:RNA polymerase sigma-70 factor (ECF subfamily)
MNSIAPGIKTSVAAYAELGDDALLECMRDDNETAFRILVERHLDRAYGLALRLLKNVADAEDVSQEAFVKVWVNRQDWEFGRAKFTTWLYRVVVNRCIDLRRRPRNEGLDDVPEPMDEADDALVTIHKREVSGRIDAAMARLPAQQRVAVMLSYYDDLTNAEIAEIMGRTVDSVESLLKRGRQALREILRRSTRDCGHSLAGP